MRGSRHCTLDKRDRGKSYNTVAARMKAVVERMIQSQKHGEPHQQITVFMYKSQQSEIISLFLQEMRQENISLFNNKQMLLDVISARYDELGVS